MFHARPRCSAKCPFCTARHQLPVVQAQDSADAFSLCNLLPAGTITVTVHDGEPPCPRACDVREWCFLPAQKSFPRSEDTLFRRLAFLTQHLFLRATCTLGTSGRTIFIRLYLIPNDLPNVCGQLHCRTERVLKKARRYMLDIVPLIEQTSGLWDADETCLDAPQKHFLPRYIDNRTMAEIYSDLPSLVLNPPTENTRLSHHVASGGAIWGLRTTLYGYQRHSVAVMLERESSATPVPDPLYIPVSCVSSVRCYIQPSTMSVLRECPTFSPPRAGILCEELGTGKTVMIIALVLATASQLPDPEESVGDVRPILTPLAYNHFPFAEYALARKKAGLGCAATQQVPSLFELLVHYFSSLKVETGRPAFADEVEACHLWPLIRANTPFYHHYNTEANTEASTRSHRRNTPNPSPRIMYLSSATLVIVPLSLLGQWESEIDKHCHDAVRYLVVRSLGDLPHPRKLASDYELIVMSDLHFRGEFKKNKMEKLHDLAPCTCPYRAGYRVPDCHCPRNPHVTPLLQIRWKRLVIDEGHTASNMASIVNHLIRKLSIQHKWIVTGTPTSNILGLQLGRTLDEHESDHHIDSVELTPGTPPPDSPVSLSPSPDDEISARIWGSYDRQNLHKLGAMIGDFLAVPRFRADAKAFTDHITTPLCNRHGPLPGAIQVVTQVMQMAMVRHRIEDVEKDVVLPPMKHDVVYIDLDHYALKSYNAMQASLAINAIDSEREGPDYLFHPSKAKALQVAISNSFQGLFWSSSDIMYNVDQICEYADEYLGNAVRRKINTDDLDLLKQALKHAKAAADDKLWRAMQRYADVPFKVSGLDPAIFEAWTRTGFCEYGRAVDVMHPDRLVNLRSLVRRDPLIPIDDLIEEGNIVDREERDMMASKAMKPRKAKRGGDQTTENSRVIRETIKDVKEHIERMNDQELEDHDRIDQVEEAVARVTSPSSLSGVQVGPSLSTKLNYVLSEILRYSAKEKFLIFSNSALTLLQIGEALSLFEIKHLRYTDQESYLLKDQYILTFETSDVHRVLLVKLNLGARGLNLISASRVIFCEPVWHPDVESQAIKRVHRIGQTRPVTVRTLAIRSTPEEAMIARRQYLRTSDKVPSMTTDSSMRQYLQYPRFLDEVTSSNVVSMVLPLDDRQLVDTQAGMLEDEGGASRVDVDLHTISHESDGNVLARKRVRFE